MVLLVVLDGAVVAVVAVAGNEVDFCVAAVASSLVGFRGVIFVVVAVPIAWNATKSLYELAGIFLCLVMIIVLVVPCFGATVLGVDTKVIVPGVVTCVVLVFDFVGLDCLSSVIVRLLLLFLLFSVSMLFLLLLLFSVCMFVYRCLSLLVLWTVVGCVLSVLFVLFLSVVGIVFVFGLYVLAAGVVSTAAIGVVLALVSSILVVFGRLLSSLLLLSLSASTSRCVILYI